MHFFISSNHCSLGTASTEGQYIMPLYWLCPVSAVLNCPHFLHVLRRTLQVRFRTGAGAAEERLAPRACGAAPSTGPCEVTGPSMNSWGPEGGAGKSSRWGHEFTAAGATADDTFLFTCAWPTVLPAWGYWWTGPGWGGCRWWAHISREERVSRHRQVAGQVQSLHHHVALPLHPLVVPLYQGGWCGSRLQQPVRKDKNMCVCVCVCVCVCLHQQKGRTLFALLSFL